MNALRRINYLCLLALLILALPLSSCGVPAQQETEEQQPTVIEQGVPEDDPAQEEEQEEEEPVEQFPDLGENAGVEDLTAALNKVSSYYFEQSVAYPQGSVFMQVWFKDGCMKLVTSVDGYGLTESYYDYNAGTVVDYYPGASETASRSSFDPFGENAPSNPKMENYTDDVVVGNEVVDRQYCLILQTAAGDKLWVGTKYGFPLRVEYTDSLGERYTVDYKNLSINTVTDDDVALPADLQVTD